MVSSEIHYSINGKPCRGDEYLDLIEEVFTRKDPDVETVELQNGEFVSLGGNVAHVTVQHHKHDGTIWSPATKAEITKKDVVILLSAFIQGDNTALSSYGATVSSQEQHKGVDLSEGGRIDGKLGRLFIIFLLLAAVSALICGLAGARPIFIIPAFLFIALALVFFTTGGIAKLIDICRYLVRSLARDRENYSSWRMALMYVVSAISIISVFVFFVFLPMYIIIFLIWKAFHLS